MANATPLSRRERAAVTLAGVVPDIDGLGIVADILTRNSAEPLDWWGRFHHVLAHNLGFGLLVMAVAWGVAARRTRVALLAFLTFHLHLLGDLVGSRGPDDEPWPIPYALPFSDAWQLTWHGQWELNAWPNFALTLVLLGIAFHLAWWRGFSPVELLSRRADRAFVETLRARFGTPSAPVAVDTA